MPGEFESFLADLFAPLGGVSMQRMFGGVGIRRDGVMFALVSDETLYFKVDETTRAAYEAEGSEPFSYPTRDGRTTIASYWRAPERLFDEPEAFLAYAQAAHAAALRADTGKRKGKGNGKGKRGGI